MTDEDELVRAFLLPARRKRYLDFLRNPKGRAKFTRELAHFSHRLNPKYLKTIPPQQQNAVGIATILQQRGAPALCWIISENSEIDGRQMSLLDALHEIVGRQMGTLLSCIPGQLGYFEDEDVRYLLERSERPK